MLKFILLLIITVNTFSQEKKLTVFYLNGVLNEESEAKASGERVARLLNSRLALEPELQEKLKPDEVVYTYAYNQSELLLDFYETIAQKLKEARDDLTEEQAYKLLASIIFLGDVKDNVFLEFFDPAGVLQVRESLAEASAKYILKTKNISASEITEKINTEGLANTSTLVVSHSQGNLFANEVSNGLKTALPDKIKYYANLQVGSAAASISADTGDYITAKQDNIIVGLLNKVLGFSILSPNVELYNYLFTNIGQYHSFNDIYTSDKVLGALDRSIGVKPMSDHFSDKAFDLIDKIIPDPKNHITKVEVLNVDDQSMSVKLKVFFDEDGVGKKLSYIRQDVENEPTEIATLVVQPEPDKNGEYHYIIITVPSSKDSYLFNLDSERTNISIPNTGTEIVDYYPYMPNVRIYYAEPILDSKIQLSTEGSAYVSYYEEEGGLRSFTENFTYPGYPEITELKYSIASMAGACYTTINSDGTQIDYSYFLRNEIVSYGVPLSPGHQNVGGVSSCSSVEVSGAFKFVYVQDGKKINDTKTEFSFILRRNTIDNR